MKSVASIRTRTLEREDTVVEVEYTNIAVSFNNLTVFASSLGGT